MKTFFEIILDIQNEMVYSIIVKGDTIIGHRFKPYHLNPRIGNADEQTIFLIFEVANIYDQTFELTSCEMQQS